MDASNLLKPALARGELHCIGATTLDEYRKHVEKDAALARRFQPVFVSPADGRGHDLDPARPEGEIRGAPRRPHHRRRDRRRRDAVEPLHRRPLPARQGDRPDRRGRRRASACRSIPSPRSSTNSTAASCSSRSSRRRCARRPTPPRATGWRSCSAELGDLQEKSDALTARWKAEKDKIGVAQKLKEELDAARNALAQAQRKGDYAEAGRLAYGVIPDLEKKLAASETQPEHGAWSTRR